MFVSHPNITINNFVLPGTWDLNKELENRERERGLQQECLWQVGVGQCKFYKLWAIKIFYKFIVTLEIETWSCWRDYLKHSILTHYFSVLFLQLNSVQQLINQWRNRVNELKSLNTSTAIALVSIGEFSTGKYLLPFCRISLWIYETKL